MVDQSRIINVIIASPGDLKEERSSIPENFLSWNKNNPGIYLTPRMWESGSVPTLGKHPQQILNKQIVEDGDLLVALFWTKLGTPTPNALSGTVEEIEEFINKKGAARVMIYFCTRPIPQSPDNINTEELARLQNFKEEIKARGLYDEFETKDEFTGKLYRHLDTKVNQLLNNELPTPEEQTTTLAADSWYNPNHSDSRLREPIDFGISLTDIAKNFSKRMKEFDQVDGACDEKFLDLGVHVYRSLARSIEHIIVLRPFEIPHSTQSSLQQIVLELKIISDSRSSERFSEFWEEGKRISKKISMLTKNPNKKF